MRLSARRGLVIYPEGFLALIFEGFSAATRRCFQWRGRATLVLFFLFSGAGYREDDGDPTRLELCL